MTGWTDTPHPGQRCLRVKQPRANVLIAHGFAEHGGRYLEVAESLAEIRCSTYAWDLRGWGESLGESDRGFGRLLSFGEYCENLEATLRTAASKGAAPVPSFVLGHSMGALVALLVALRKPKALAGVIVTSPALRFAQRVPPLKHAAARVASIFRPFHEFTSELDPDLLTHDEKRRAALRSDPLWQPVTRARWYTECLLAQREVRERAGALRVPLLVLAAGYDRIVDLEATREYFARVASTDKTLRIFEGLYHEVLQEREPDRRKVLDELKLWIAARY